MPKEKKKEEEAKNKQKEEDKKGKKIESNSQKVKIKTGSEKINKRDAYIKTLKIGLLTTSIFLIIIYSLLNLFYHSGAFTVILDQDFARRSGIIMYENMETKEVRSILEAPRPEVMDNISINWLPKNINEESDGSHNGQNYIAYTFYIENEGLETHYWYSIVIDDVIKDVDEAVRIMVYLNDESTVYAKIARNGEAERNTTPFFSEDFALMEKRERIQPGGIDKFTVVIWVEGDDPDCIDALIGGEMKMHMEITEESIITI